MKTTKLFFMAALALMTAACSNDDNDLTQQPAKAEGIPFTATISIGESGTTRALSESGSTLVATWDTGEKVALIYTVSATTYVKEAEVTPQGDGTATISTTLDGSPVDDTDVTIVYPASAVDESTKDVKTNLLASQNGLLTGTGSIAEKYELRKTTTPAKLKIDGTTASLKGTVSLTNQNAIFKFTVKNADASATIDVNSLTITIGSDNYVITPASATSTLYAALPAVSGQTVSFSATGSDSKTYTCSKDGVTFAAGNYYQSTLKMAEAAPAYTMAASATASDKGKLICADGHIHAYDADAACTKSRVAKIIYIGTTGHATYSHGLALALTDEGQMAWQAAIDACSAKNTSTPVTDATWLLASKDQWNYMLGANGAGSYTTLRDGFTSVGGSNLLSVMYWSSTENYLNVQAWCYDFGYGQGAGGYESNGSDIRVRACLAF